MVDDMTILEPERSLPFGSTATVADLSQALTVFGAARVTGLQSVESGVHSREGVTLVRLATPALGGLHRASLD